MSGLLLSSAYDSPGSFDFLVGGDAPLGLRRLQHQAREKGITVDLDPRHSMDLKRGDCSAARDKLRQHLAQVLPTLDFVGVQFSSLEEAPDKGGNDELNPTIETLRQVCKQGVPLIVGGVGMTMDGERLMSALRREIGVEFEGSVGIAGEADILFPQVAKEGPQSWKRNERLFRSVDGGIPPGVIQTLSQEELWGLSPLDPDYFDNRYSVITESVGRGCKSNCSYCSVPSLNEGPRGMRVFTPEQYVRQIEANVMGGRLYLEEVASDVFDAPLSWWDAVESKLKDSELNPWLKWVCVSGFTNAFRLRLSNCLGAPGRITKMRNLGFNHFSLGVQSVQPSVLRNVHRSPVDEKVIQDFIVDCHRNGITTSIDFMVGLPGQEEGIEADLVAALKMSLLGARIQFHAYKHRFGSRLYDGPAPEPLSDETIEGVELFKWLCSWGYYLFRMTLSTEEMVNYFPKISQFGEGRPSRDVINDFVINCLEVLDRRGDSDLWEKRLKGYVSNYSDKLNSYRELFGHFCRETDTLMDDPNAPDSIKIGVLSMIGM